jgi:hypothetical protein
VTVRNPGARRVVVEVARSGYALDLRGRPRIARKRAIWFRARPSRLVLDPGRAASLRVDAAIPRHAEPGDHPSLLLLTTRPLQAKAVALRMRLGVVVVVRVPGRVVHRLQPLRLRAHGKRTLELLVANGGNVTESITGACLRLELRRGKRVLVVVRPLPRDVLPRTRGLVVFRYAVKLHGRVTARIVTRPSCSLRVQRTFPLRL